MTGPHVSHRRKDCNEYGLSQGEMEVLRLLAQGCSKVQIAEALQWKVRSVSTRISNIKTQLLDMDHSSDEYLVQYARRQGIVP